ncbi:Cwf15/Cwc15 cell cycle control protein [Exidia glandulosa HHB12029]|uniref:Cwf15/Cwc15 cell cycle control protein n=1 Tax=Exidia glandulosa HHB12029 TaxID=1314781 RepID=A0A165KR88_EXIGL|nr:Cwf15/Cwc15 cell cycle control protein [Exidia glandulosa HHB12029]
MSTAHRPTWDPAQGRERAAGSRQYSSRDMAQQTKLKFRQPGQMNSSDVARRDLRMELLAAEAAARDKKRKAEGLPAIEDASNGDQEANKRRKVLQEALDLDKDDDDEDEDAAGPSKASGAAQDDDEESDEDSDDDEDDTAELLRELEKIKRERAEEKARQEAQANALSQADREMEIATANPLLNLAAALGQANPGLSTNAPGTFAVKRRWDDDLIFKNQAVNSDKPSGQFVNDLLRTEFHRKFMSKFIK